MADVFNSQGAIVIPGPLHHEVGRYRKLQVNPETFLFVHGLWHSSWVWDEVVLRIQKVGHTAIVMNLPSRAGDPTPPEAITLATHAEAICSVVRRHAARQPLLLRVPAQRC